MVRETGVESSKEAKMYCEGTSRKHSSLHKESPAEVMLLAFVWDETASDTARSKTENGLHS